MQLMISLSISEQQHIETKMIKVWEAYILEKSVIVSSKTFVIMAIFQNAEDLDI